MPLHAKIVDGKTEFPPMNDIAGEFTGGAPVLGFPAWLREHPAERAALGWKTFVEGESPAYNADTQKLVPTDIEDGEAITRSYAVAEMSETEIAVRSAMREMLSYV